MANEKLSIWLSFLKILLGTSVISIATLILNHEIQEREIALKEMEVIGKFVEHALTEDVGVRLRFA